MLEPNLNCNIKVEPISEPSTSFSSEGRSVSQDLASQLVTSDSSFSVSNDAEAEFWASEALLASMEYERAEGEYFFDSDHHALKGNSDYKKLLNTILILEAQRAKAIRDLEKLYEYRDKALSDPIGFADKLQHGEDLGLSGPQKLPEIPDIDWSKYAITPSETAFEKRQLTRQSTKLMCDLLSPASQGRSSTEDDKSKVFSDSKMFKLNHPWTAEEQKKLEELLVIYPPEEIETRRWEKIASELENRTPIQVASRVQKYFIKLMRAGMPIPGRQPNAIYNRKLRRHVVRQKPSTFFASYMPALFMTCDDQSMSCDEDSRPTSQDGSSSDSEEGISEAEEIDEKLKLTKEYKELLAIKKTLKQKKGSQGLAQHVGFRCERCECEPIIGTRWHCVECEVSTDFCDDCVDCMHETETHSAYHRLEVIHQSMTAGLSSAYTHFPSTSFTYLDPNYAPLS